MINETDPNGIDQHSPGAKMDSGKVRAALVLQDFGKALIEVSRVGTFGAEKYTPHGWLSVKNGEERYLDAAMRHILKAGMDEDSGLDHLAHAAWNILAVLELKNRDETVKDPSNVELEKDAWVEDESHWTDPDGVRWEAFEAERCSGCGREGICCTEKGNKQGPPCIDCHRNDKRDVQWKKVDIS